MFYNRLVEMPLLKWILWNILVAVSECCCLHRQGPRRQAWCLAGVVECVILFHNSFPPPPPATSHSKMAVRRMHLCPHSHRVSPRSPSSININHSCPLSLSLGSLNIQTMSCQRSWTQMRNNLTSRQSGQIVLLFLTYFLHFFLSLSPSFSLTLSLI